MSRQPAQLSIDNGIFSIDGQQRLLVTSEYPYFRDHPSNWKDRLLKLKSIGIDIITSYIPWRHHQPEAGSPPDFLGLTQSNRNVLGFIDLCKSLDLLLIAKPGPFIHAETNYGGLPDWVCPLNNPAVEPMLNNRLKAVTWGGSKLESLGSLVKWPLPAPLGDEFFKLTSTWLKQVSENVISPSQYPQGPVVIVQLGNEGLYSDAQHALWDLDYSVSGLNEYRLFLQNKYASLSEYNLQHATQFDNWQDIIPPFSWNKPETENERNVYLDWGEFQAAYMLKVFSLWQDALGLDIPAVTNLNPPVGDDFGVDSWFGRVEPERWKNIHFGFSNWIGEVSSNPSAFNRYLLTAKRFPGPNLEENWSFSKIYDPAYSEASTSFYQTLVILNGGATGFNIYTGVGTAYEDKSLDSLSSSPYPDVAPITEKGEITYKAEFISWVTDFFTKYGKEFLHSIPQEGIGWGYYLPDARVNAWNASSGEKEHEFNSSQYLNHFQNEARRLNVDYGLINLEQASLDDLLKYKRLIFVGSRYLTGPVKEKLSAYVQTGGHLALLGQQPDLDDIYEVLNLETGTDKKIVHLDTGNLPDWLMEADRPQILEGKADIWVRSHPEKNIHFITVLFPKGHISKVKFSISLNHHQHHICVEAAPSGGAIFRLENESVTDCIIKGVNGYLDIAVKPNITIDNETTGLDEPGDFSLIAGVIKSQKMIG